MFDELLGASQTAIRNVDTYLSFPENQLARAAVTRLYSSRRTALFGSITLIHGPVGVGKTHLTLSALKELNRRHPETKFAYTSVKDHLRDSSAGGRWTVVGRLSGTVPVA